MTTGRWNTEHLKNGVHFFLGRLDSTPGRFGCREGANSYEEPNKGNPEGVVISQRDRLLERCRWEQGSLYGTVMEQFVFHVGECTS